METTVTVGRVPGSDPVERISAGPYEVEFLGDGPWTLPLKTWTAVECYLTGSIQLITDGNPNPAGAAGSEDHDG